MADTDCTLLAFSRQKYEELASAHPNIAMEVQRVILTRSAILRNKLQRELHAVSSIERESVRQARQAQMKGYRSQLRCIYMYVCISVCVRVCVRACVCVSKAAAKYIYIYQERARVKEGWNGDEIEECFRIE